MDENYLDSLLNQVSQDKKQNNNFDYAVDEDSSVDIDLSDLDNISLGEMDGLDDIDLSDLDLDDIDFDDVDITRLKTDDTQQSVSAQEDDSFNLDALLQELEAQEEDIQEEQTSDTSVSRQQSQDETETDVPDISENSAEPAMDFLQDEVFNDAQMQMQEDTDIPDVLAEDDMVSEEDASGNLEAITDEPQDVDSMDLDDLFSALGIDDTPEQSEENPYTASEDSLDELFKSSMELGMEDGALDDIEDISEVKPSQKKKNHKKKTISEILFGEPDADDMEEERLLAEKKADRAVKKQQKQEQKDTKKAQKQEMLELKKHEESKKKQDKENKKAQKRKKLEAELEEEKNEKKVSTPVVIVVFALFAALAIVVILGTKEFNYSQVIQKAADYFERQRYHLAYDEVSGVDVRQKDEELRDRIYTVMYVERLYESYENNMAMNRPDKALDALLRGLEKYDEHYDEAVELGIVEDIDSCRAKILAALSGTYGLSESQAYDIMKLEGQAYTQMLTDYSEALQTGE